MTSLLVGIGILWLGLFLVNISLQKRARAQQDALARAIESLTETVRQASRETHQDVERTVDLLTGRRPLSSGLRVDYFRDVSSVATRDITLRKKYWSQFEKDFAQSTSILR